MNNSSSFDNQPDQPSGKSAQTVLNFEATNRLASARRKGASRSKVVPYPHAAAAPFRNPLDVALMESVIMTDCSLEATLIAGPSKHEGQEICVLLGYQDAMNYYYVHLGNMAAGHVNHLYCVQDNVPRPMPVKFSVNTTWLPGTEHRLRVERSVRDGMIRVYFDDLTTPVMEAVDCTFDQGKVGLGSFGADLQLHDVQIKGVRARNFMRPTLAEYSS